MALSPSWMWRQCDDLGHIWAPIWWWEEKAPKGDDIVREVGPCQPMLQLHCRPKQASSHNKLHFLTSTQAITQEALNYTKSDKKLQKLFFNIFQRHLTAGIPHLWHIKITAPESTDIMYTSRNLAIVPCSLSLAGNTTRTGRIVGIIATSVVENQEFIARDTFKIRSTFIVVPVRSFRHEFVARLATSHAIGPSIRRRSQRHNACVDTHSSLVLSHNGLLKVDKQVLPSFRTYQK